MFWEAVWSPSSLSKIPLSKMKPVGEDPNGFLVYVARAEVDGHFIPGKFILEKKKCYVSQGGKEIGFKEFELLLDDNYTWIESSHGALHANAVIGGTSEDGETLFIGRAWHEGHLIPGKVHPTHKSLYIPFRGAEHAYEKYEILVKEEDNEIPVPIPLDPHPNDITDNEITFPTNNGTKHQSWRQTADKMIECQLCEERMIETIFIPCGHGACLRCGHGYENCFKCREKIQQVQKVCFE